jgi:hypothetical protein
MQIKVGDIYFINDKNSLFGRLITYYNNKIFKQSDVTHCGIVTKVESDRILIHEAGKIFNSSWYEDWWLEARINEGKVKFTRSKTKLNKVFETAESYNHIGYGWLDIIGIGLHALFDWKVLGITGKNKLICSEAVVRILYDCSDKEINFEDEYGIKFDAISPQHIWLSKFMKKL